MDTSTHYHNAIAFLEGLTNLPPDKDYMVDRKNPDIYLKRMKYFLDLIGNPEKNFKHIHVAGTAGKGTVTDMIHEILFVSGKKVGSFSSPPVVTDIERIKVGGLYISPNEFANIVERLKPYIDIAYDSGPFGGPSTFELLLAIAFVYFKKQKCEWVVLEVGLGGRFDATNIIARPKITAVTSIDYDHTELLGKTLTKIASDKAGIIKRGSYFFTAEQRPTILKIFKKICKKNEAFFHQIPHQPDHREYNKTLATVIAAHLGVTHENIINGIKQSRLPCRFEIMRHKPLIVLDGAHNRSKMKATLADLKKYRFRKLFLVLGIAANKDHASILKHIIPVSDHILITRFQNKDRKCARPKELADKAKPLLKKGATIEKYSDPNMALVKAVKMANKNDAVLVTGSFYLAGELRKHWYPEEKILRLRKSF